MVQADSRRAPPVCHFAMPPNPCSIAPELPAARVIAPYARTLWDAALAAGVPQPALARVLGRDAPEEDDMPAATYLALLHCALQHAGPGFGWRLGQSVKPTSYGINGIVLLACPTLGEALAQVLRFESLVHDLGRSSFVRQGDRVEYGWINHWAGHPAAEALAESVFAGIHTCAQWLAGRPITGFELQFMHHPDAATLAAIEQGTAGRVRTGCAANLARLDAAVLDWPIPQANRALLPLLAQHAEALLTARRPHEAGVAAQVRQCILRRLGRQEVRLVDVAGDLHLSTRTLQRRLAEASIAFQALLDGIRHELACHYLGGSELPIASIADLLGYQESPAFHHAFKQWQGVGPGQYRAQVRAGAHPVSGNNAI